MKNAEIKFVALALISFGLGTLVRVGFAQTNTLNYQSQISNTPNFLNNLTTTTISTTLIEPAFDYNALTSDEQLNFLSSKASDDDVLISKYAKLYDGCKNKK